MDCCFLGDFCCLGRFSDRRGASRFVTHRLPHPFLAKKEQTFGKIWKGAFSRGAKLF